MEELDARDLELLLALRSALDEVIVPPAVVDAAKTLFDLRDLDVELATLTHDALVDGTGLTAVRSGESGSWTLAFAGPSLSIELEVKDDPLRVVGQIIPAVAADVVVQQREGRQEVRTDASGMFSVTLATGGPVRLVVTTPNGRVATEWLLL